MVLLSALPAIFSAVSAVSDLFDDGKKTVQKITGKESEASSPEELQEEILSLPLERQEQWAKAMHQKVEMYGKQNERLLIEQGSLEHISEKVSQEMADEVAFMRQTTRPWAVRMSMHFILIPAYLIGIDVVQQVIIAWVVDPFMIKISPFHVFDYVFGTYSSSSLMDTATNLLGQPKTMFAQIYVDTVPWLTGIVGGYMGLRQWDKNKGVDVNKTVDPTSGTGSNMLKSIPKLVSTGMNLVEKVKRSFR